MIITIAAVAENNVIGNKNKLIWHLPKDLKRFKSLTTGHPIIMGRNTFESIGKPLPNRTTIVVTNNKDQKFENVLTASSLEEAFSMAQKINQKIFVVGGGQIYKNALEFSDVLEITEVHKSFEGDVFFPEIDKNNWKEIRRENHSKDENHEFDYSFVTYEKK